MKITIFMDNPESWYRPFAKQLYEKLKINHKVSFCFSQKEIKKGDCLLLLSVEHVVKKDILDKNKHNIVVHSSPLPKGKGWAPLTWQILMGQNSIVNTLFEAVEAVDAGPIYEQNMIKLSGHELLDEIHKKQGDSINKLIVRFINRFPNIKGKKQTGRSTYFRRRNAEDSKLDVYKNIAEQFNLLRVSDNQKYPAFFNYRGHKYVVKIYKASTK